MADLAEPDDPVVWLLLLERGRQTSDFELAARAKLELERLGIRVIYKRPRGRVMEVDHAER